KSNRSLVYSIESLVISWSHQVHKALLKDSAQPLLDGLNPTPSAEIDFWEAQVANLENIFDQLNAPKARQLAQILEGADSNYFTPFKEMFKSVVVALREAQDIHVHLTSLRPYIQELEQAEFDQIPRQIQPIFHLLCLIWANSKSMRKPGRIVIILQELCNLIIDQCRTYLDPVEILKADAEEAIAKVEETLRTLQIFKHTYDEYRSKLADYFRNVKDERGKAVQPVLWEFKTELAFGRFDAFTERVKEIQHLMATYLEYMKLEKVVFGGTSGQSLNAQLQEISEKFFQAYKVFGDRTYDTMDSHNEEFTTDCNTFKDTVKDLDYRLANVMGKAMDDCTSAEQFLKLIAILASFLERPIIRDACEPKYRLLLQMIDDEIEIAKTIYDHHTMLPEKQDPASIPGQTSKSEPSNHDHRSWLHLGGWGKDKRIRTVASHGSVHKNMPRVAGNIQWASELTRRISIPVEMIGQLDLPLFQMKNGEIVWKKYQQMLKLLQDYQSHLFEEWTSGVDATCTVNLSHPLLVRAPQSNMLRINFDPELVAVLREAKYFRILGEENLPNAAVELFAQNEMLRNFIVSLDMSCEWYNYLYINVTPTETELIREELVDLDEYVKKAETIICWNSEGAWTHIQLVHDRVQDLQRRVVQAQDNLQQQRNIMSTWSKLPLFERKDSRRDTLLSLDDREDRRHKRYVEIKEAGERISSILEDTRILLKAEEGSSGWDRYVLIVDGIVEDGLCSTIECSLNYLLSETEDQPSTAVLFEVYMELQTPDVVFCPSLDTTSTTGLYKLIEGMVDDIYKQAQCIPRFASPLGGDDYQGKVSANENLGKLQQKLFDRIHQAIKEAVAYQAGFDVYSYLWMEDRNECMQQFLTYGQLLSPEDLDLLASAATHPKGSGESGEDPTLTGLTPKPPTLEQFKEQIDHYEKIYSEVDELATTVKFGAWLRVDSRKFKRALLNVIKRWSMMFKQHLIDHVITSLQNLDEFIRVTNKNLGVPLKEGDYDSLVHVMEHLSNVRERQTATDELFEPLKQTIELLKTYKQELPDEVHKLLEVSPNLSVTIDAMVEMLDKDEPLVN
ncbi:unnamed protein product, partial [Dicrocoelium dendriticum]